MNLDSIKNALLTVTDKVYHYKAYNQTDKYIVWTEDGQGDSSWADSKMQEQIIEGTIDYFTKSDSDDTPERIQEALNNGEISWRLNSIQHEDKTKFIHYEWVWQLGTNDI